MPSRKEIQWSQLRVGVLVLSALAILMVLVFLMSGSSGGFFARKVELRVYFPNAGGVKVGAPVSLQGVTIGNVTKIRIVPERGHNPIEITLRVGKEYEYDLHTDSIASIDQAGVLGDNFIDIDSSRARGPIPHNNAELPAGSGPSIEDVVRSSNVSLEEVTTLIRKMETLVDSLNSRRGTVGDLINDPALGQKITRIATDLETISGAMANGKGSLGKLIDDDTLYTRANSAVDHLNHVATDLDEGKGTAGKLLKDETLYNNLNATVANANQLLAQVNSGQGALGKLAKDPAFAQKLDDTVTRLDSILTSVDEGKGTLGQLVQNPALYNHADASLDQAQQLIQAIRENPKKFLVIRMKVF
jgi:phospholipid/cholesterol/gamma-HCH transport system substrate-binding protein